MATYLELKEQGEKLLAQAEAMRHQETQDAIADIRRKMQDYDITPQDLGFGASGTTGRRGAPRKDAKAAKAPRSARYRGPNGETYSGGRGPKPRWLKDALAQGKRLEDFEQK